MGCSSTKTKREATTIRTSAKMLLCPFCKVDIPFVTLQLNKGQHNLLINCACSPQTNLVNLKEYIDCLKRPYAVNSECDKHNQLVEKFCINTSTWFCRQCLNELNSTSQQFNFVDNKISVTCPKHFKSFCSYCENCNINICDKCNDEHTNHELIQLAEIDSELMDKNYSLMNSLISKNKQIHKTIIDEIDNEIVKDPSKSEDLMLIKRELSAAWKINESVNELLKQLYYCFMLTVGSIKKYPCYQLLKLFNTFQLNDIDVDLNYQSIVERASVWKNHLDYNWLIIQRDIKKEEKRKVIRIEFKEKKEEESPPIKKVESIKQSKYKLIETLSEHLYPVRCLAKLSDNKFASGSDDKTIKIWNTFKMTCENTLVGHINSVWCLTLLHDGTLVSGSFDKSIKFWSAESWICKSTLLGHNYSVRCLAQLNERTLASGSVDKTIKLWSIVTLTCKYTFNGHSSFVWSLAQINNDILASGSEDTTVKLWNTTTMDYKETMRGHTFAIKSLVLLNSNILVSGSADTLIKLWNIKELNCIATLYGHEFSVECLIRINDKTIISGSDDKSIRVWNTNSMKCSCSLEGHLSYIWCLLKLNNKQFVSGSWDNSIKIWSIPQDS